MSNAWQGVVRAGTVPVLWSLLACTALAGLGLAWWAQHGWGMEPCSWCVLQRLLVMILAIWALLGAGLAVFLGRVGRVCWAAGGSVLTLLGVLAAGYQEVVAAQSTSCAFTWPDRVFMTLGLAERWPDMFEARASCADAALARLAGLPFAAWSGLGFVLMACLAGYIGWRAWRGLP